VLEVFTIGQEIEDEDLHPLSVARLVNAFND
jgi:hypothetical protein